MDVKTETPTAVARIGEARENWNWRISVGEGQPAMGVFLHGDRYIVDALFVLGAQ
jgi:hypothetical protein